MIYEIFRIIGLITGYPFQLLFFKRKTYYVDKKNTMRFAFLIIFTSLALYFL